MAGNKRWSDKEISVLRKYYAGSDIKELVKKLPNRSVNSIHKKASDLGVSFTKNERTNLDLRIDDLFSKLENVINRLDRIDESIRLMRDFRKKQNAKWSDEDDKFLIENLKKIHTQEISNILGRTESSVRQRASLLNLVKKYDLEKNNSKRRNFYKSLIGTPFLDLVEKEQKEKVVVRNLLSYYNLNVVGGIIVDKSKRTPLEKIDFDTLTVKEIAKKYHYSVNEIKIFLKSKKNDRKRKIN